MPQSPPTPPAAPGREEKWALQPRSGGPRRPAGRVQIGSERREGRLFDPQPARLGLDPQGRLGPLPARLWAAAGVLWDSEPDKRPRRPLLPNTLCTSCFRETGKVNTESSTETCLVCGLLHRDSKGPVSCLDTVSELKSSVLRRPAWT